MNTGDKNIIDNLRNKYGDKLSNVTDADLLHRFEDWNLSDKSEDALLWLTNDV